MGFATEEGEILAARSILQFLDIGIIAANTSVTPSFNQPKFRKKQHKRKERGRGKTHILKPN